MTPSLAVHLRTAYQQFIDDAITDLILLDNCKPSQFKKRLLALVDANPTITVTPKLTLENGIVHLTLNVENVSGVEDSDIVALLNEIEWTDMIDSGDNYILLTDPVQLDSDRLTTLIKQM